MQKNNEIEKVQNYKKCILNRLNYALNGVK